MDSNVKPLAWKRYLATCESLGYQPEATVETNLLQHYKTLYARYCQDNGLQFDPSTNFDSDVDQQKLSELLYLRLCSELGYESIIQNRRNITNLAHQIINQDKRCILQYLVGSRGEGFRMITSDYDCMLVYSGNLVVNNTTEIPELSCVKLNKPVMIMETQYTKPGYVRLILETEKYMPSERMSSSIHNDDDKLYVSSALYRKQGQIKESHGPAKTLKTGTNEYDVVRCESCTSQPTAVQNWEMRCKEYNWPNSVVLEQCISLGCQLAPVGSKESPHEHIEWRISFILMENTLLQSLSHSQFMCYGLLKVYLKEVLGSFEEIKDLVSSYFMKTVLLWEIQTNREHNVGADSLLQVFRNCLQRLFRCVEEKNCPNFFIPENNMFENRIYGKSQYTLQNILKLLFTERFYGLYRCQSIDLPRLIFQVLVNENQSVVVSVNEGIHVTNEDIERYTWIEISQSFYLFQDADLDTFLKKLELILKKDSLTDLEKRAVQRWISGVTVQITTHNFEDIIAPNVSPYIVWEKCNSCYNIFRTHDYNGSVVPLYLATLMYITGRYRSCLHVIMECIKKCNYEGSLNNMAVSVYLQLTELRLELALTFHMDFDIEWAYLRISPEIYLSMLSFLCHYHLGDVDGTEIEFQRLRKMSYTQALYMEEMYWQVFGICAEIIGKYDEAYQSYVRAYKSPRNSLVGNASLLRVLCLIYKLLPRKMQTFT